MANPQLEKGYIRVSTELFKAIYYNITNPTHLRLMLFVIRFTYGYKRKEFLTNITSISTTLRLTDEYCRSMISDMENYGFLHIEWKSHKKIQISLNKN